MHLLEIGKVKICISLNSFYMQAPSDVLVVGEPGLPEAPGPALGPDGQHKLLPGAEARGGGRGPAGGWPGVEADWGPD